MPSPHAPAHDVWVEHEVYIHATAYTKDNIQGTLSMRSTQNPATAASLALGFRVANPDDPRKKSFEYPLSHLRSLRLAPPSPVRTYGSATVRTNDETPPVTLFFHQDTQDTDPKNWGGRRLLDALQPYAEVVASRQDPGLYLVNPDKELRALHLAPVFDDDALEHGRGRSSTPETFSQWAHLTRISVLAQFSHVTRSARQSRDALWSNPLVRRALPQKPSATQSNAQAGPYMVSSQKGAGAQEEFDAARVYLAKWAQFVAREGERNQIAEDVDVESLLGTTPIPSAGEAGAMRSAPALTSEAWMSLLDSGENATTLAQHIFHRGITAEARRDVWPFLFGVVPATADAARREAQWRARIDEYNRCAAKWRDPHAALSEDVESSKHRIWIDCLRTDPKHPFFAETEGADAAFASMQASGWERLPHQGSGADRVNHHLYALSDVLLTFCLYADQDEELAGLHGYVQGMSDLCVVCYVACEGDLPRTFWCLVGVMRRLGANFVHDQTGMRSELLTLQRLLAELCPSLYTYLQAVDGLNLFFCFRWILVCFRREFELSDVQRLWDAIWAASWSAPSDAVDSPQWPLCHNFELFVALAILESHADVIVRHLRTFDEVLQYIHSLAYQMDVHAILRRAEALVYRLRGRTQHPHTELEESLSALVLR
ncbi:GTPase activating protein [Malassezia obtusa]|uniref:GTPase activating protein n=1 Tax=Malassezia obtusa TaxID=76774 RepID=A0AAF0E1B0_9BASI|nr:GTPase activating protein [Malassezia obtusa]